MSEQQKIVKQVIVIRSDLKMRRGKEIAQGSHVSMSFLVQRIKDKKNGLIYEQDFSEEERTWLDGSFTKICLKVNSEQELFEIHEKAKAAGLTSHLIIDNGTTEFKGVKTPTAVAIGPHESDKINLVTSHLALY